MAKPPSDPRNDTREARLKAALRANLARRKAQGRARANEDVAGDAHNEQNGHKTPPNGRMPENEG